MAERIAGFFRTREAARGAEQMLLQSGFPRAGVSLAETCSAPGPRRRGLQVSAGHPPRPAAAARAFVAGDAPVHDTPAVGPIESIGAESEAGEDAFIGGAAGFAAGVIAAVLPIGPLIAAGPIAGAIGGLAVGAAAGGVIGWLRDHGVSEEDARLYAAGVSRGGALVIVHCETAARAWLARKIFQDHGATGIENFDPKRLPIAA